jgi:hypothetical protein
MLRGETREGVFPKIDKNSTHPQALLSKWAYNTKRTFLCSLRSANKISSYKFVGEMHSFLPFFATHFNK